MFAKHKLLGSLIPAAAVLVALGVTGCGSDSAGPGPTPTPTPGEYHTIETLAGSGYNALSPDGLDPLSTDFSLPLDITVGPDNNLYLVDYNNHRIRVIRNGVVETIIGTGELGDALDGLASETKLNHPTHVSFDPQGRLIMSAWHNSKIMRYDFNTGMIETICGNGNRTYSGDGGLAVDAEVDLPSCTAFGPDGQMYFTDQASVRVRKIDLQGIVTTFAGTGRPGGYSGDGGPADQAEIQLPWGQQAPPVGHCVIHDGALYLADFLNSCIRKIDLSTQIITTVAGVGGSTGFSGDGGPATAALLNYPNDIDFDSHGNMFICDTYNLRIRKVDTSGIITTVVGDGLPPADPTKIPQEVRNGDPLTAFLDRPFGIAVGPDDKLYIADTYNGRFRVVY